MSASFIVFEGIDGSGKSTQLMLAASWLFGKGIDKILLTAEPTKSGVGKRIRNILKQDLEPYTKAKLMLSLFLEDRKEHLKSLIVPALNMGCAVLCDRYKYSTICYQHAQGIPIKKIIELHKRMLVPDLTLIFDIEPEIAIERLSTKPKEKFEKLEFLKEIRELYLKLPELLPDENIKIIDANRSEEEIFKDVKRELEKIFKFEE